jgi:predicted transcriptional regulator of viral defense system
MGYLDQPYYVGLLTAAALHGAAHHRPQEFQVVTDRPTRVARAGRVRIRFVVNSGIDHTAVTSVKTTTGDMRVSTPEATALDLVRYVDVAGGYDNVSGVLAGLAEIIDAGKLAEQATRVPAVVARRTGFLLENAGAGHVAEALAENFREGEMLPQPLDPGLPKRGAERNYRWGLYVNTTVEPEPS